MAETKPYRRAKFWLIATLAIGAGAILIWLLRPPDRSLLSVATPVMPGMRFQAGSYCWLSNDEIAYVRDGRIYRHDLRSNAESPLDLPLTLRWALSNLRASPNGQWLSWTETKPVPKGSYPMVNEIHERLANLKGPRSVPHMISAGIWSLDSKRLLCYEVESGTFGKIVEYALGSDGGLTNRSVIGKATTYLDSTRFPKFVTVGTHRIRGAGNVEYDRDTSAVFNHINYEYDVMGTVRQVRARTAAYPSGLLLSAQIAPDGNEVVWLVGEPHLHPLYSILSRFGTRFVPSPRWTRNVIVCDLDGRSARAVVEIPSSGQTDVIDLRWLPDGKTLSFLYNGALYKVAVPRASR